MSKRPNVAHPREKAEEARTQKARRARDKAMKRKKAPAKKDIPAPEVYSFSRGEVEMTPAVKKWLDAEVRAQSRRYKAIYTEQEELTPMRNKWVGEFFERITTEPGFSVDGGIRRVLKKSELPKKPRRQWRVVW